MPPPTQASTSSTSSSGSGSDSFFSSWWKRPEEPKPQPGRTPAKRLSEYPPEIQQLCAGIALTSFVLGCLSAIYTPKLYTRYFRRIPNAAWVTPDLIGKKWIKGVVTSVGDADGFRLYHTPGIGWRWPLKFRRVPTKQKGLSGKNTLSIRLAGVDAPEMKNFGKPEQPYAQEAYDWLRQRIEGRMVYCQLLHRDQYERIVAMTVVPKRYLPMWFAPMFGDNLSLEMLREGYAVVYEQANSIYGSVGKEAFKDAQDEAKKGKYGMWKSRKLLETPQEYKKRHAAEKQDKLLP